jgi:hypothetical protein
LASNRGTLMELGPIFTSGPFIATPDAQVHIPFARVHLVSRQRVQHKRVGQWSK